MIGAIKRVSQKFVNTIDPPEEDDFVEVEDEGSMGYESPEGDNSRWELNYDDVLETIYRSLKNEAKTYDGKWKKQGKPLMNDEGIAHFLSYLKLIMHKGTALANIKEDYARDVTREISISYKDELLQNYKQWKIRKEYIKSVVILFTTNYYNVLTRPVDDKERKHRSKKYAMKESYSHDEVNPNEIMKL